MVPHLTTTTTTTERRRSYSNNFAASTPTSFKFPDFDDQAIESEGDDTISRGPSPKPLYNGLPPGLHSSERWPARKQRDPANRTWSSWANGRLGGGRKSRQKSLSEAIRTVRTRKASVSDSAREIAESLKAPVSLRLVVLCGFWYATSILTNTSSKAILTALPKPVTLTIIQFLLVSFWCLFLAWVAKHNRSVRDALPVLKNGIRRPDRELIMATLPLTAFQIGGHILNSDAMSRIPVSLVHTIKGLSPLMTVVAYRVFLDIRYSVPTYLSLVPLTLGVILACSANIGGDFIGLTYAFGSAVLFVTQNIVSKKIFNEAAKAEADMAPIGKRKPDKLNLLCYSSAMAFLFTCPIWLWSEGFALAADFLQDASIDLRERPGSLDHGALAAEFIFNGTFHFLQSLVAFVLLGMTSPVTYSVASLMKRVVVIMFAIVWFGNPMTSVQGFGFALTFVGLYLYDRTSDAEKADKRAREQGESKEPLLPLNVADAKKSDGPTFTQSPMSADIGQSFAGRSGYMNGDPNGSGPGRPYANGSPSANGVPISMPPGTKAEETWNKGDVARQHSGPR
ncbi:Putative transporter [Fulvia fulva]|uniref:Transporter n=1 Tax=Passalora fulva TaxID=5499 RepID=A0A9Q8L9V8_PASFU|nr:Putative transporter [Fulvia fulva]KAK4631565.1 putative transporter [Fulvia fulva]KAK4633811.1 putative transporter [Fulvia fulva]UJO13595.1 Putative transporter [Fulvia fulva]WPV10956.1 Putative transporter [Fulvia fulva]WPV25593.1 Putative transporter [Fulvia fulva]